METCYWGHMFGVSQGNQFTRSDPVLGGKVLGNDYRTFLAELKMSEKSLLRGGLYLKTHFEGGKSRHKKKKFFKSLDQRGLGGNNLQKDVKPTLWKKNGVPKKSPSIQKEKEMEAV